MRVDWAAYTCSALLGGIALASAAQPASSSIADDTPVALGMFVTACGAVALISWRMGNFVARVGEQRSAAEAARAMITQRLDAFDARLTHLAESIADLRIALRTMKGETKHD